MPRLPHPPAFGPTRFPKTCARRVDGLVDGLQTSAIPAKTDGNLLIATWNIALLGGLTRKWQTAPGDSPKRNLTDICCLAEVIARFDVCAIQETQRELLALRTLMTLLGPEWAFLTTDVTEGNRGRGERLAYIYDRRRVRPSGLAGELVLPQETLGLSPGALDRQFARTPFAVSFQAGHGKAFTLVTLHIWYGNHPRERRPELQATADWLARRARESDSFNRNLIALGDFNIDKRDDENWQAFASAGLGAPKELEAVPRTISHASTGPKFYDQIAWFTKGNREQLTLGYSGAGGFLWTEHLDGFEDDDDSKAHISDHYPLWAEFQLR